MCTLPSSSTLPGGKQGEVGKSPAVPTDAKRGLCLVGHGCEGHELKVIPLVPGWILNVRGRLLDKETRCEVIPGERGTEHRRWVWKTRSRSKN